MFSVPRKGPSRGRSSSIRSLARDLQISVITTKRAYEELERSGLIEARQGVGMFVTRRLEV